MFMTQYKKIELYTSGLLIFIFNNFMIMIKLCLFASLRDAYRVLLQMSLNLSQFLRILVTFVMN